MIRTGALAWGLQNTRGTSASLMLEPEALFTAVPAWRLFREMMDGRVWTAMAERAAPSSGACWRWEHELAHRHDDGHHDRSHDPMPAGEYSHRHQHQPMRHVHEHMPDAQHTHRH